MTRVEILETIHRWDVLAFKRIMASRLRATLIHVARIASMTGDGWPYFLVPALLYWAGFPDIFMFVVVGGTAFALERLTYVFAKRLFRRRRPANIVPGFQSHIVASDEFSFPSGHTSAAFLMITLLVIFYGPMFAWLYLWASCVGASRVILGVHFPTDTLVGAAMGTLFALLVSTASPVL